MGIKHNLHYYMNVRMALKRHLVANMTNLRMKHGNSKNHMGHMMALGFLFTSVAILFLKVRTAVNTPVFTLSVALLLFK